VLATKMLGEEDGLKNERERETWCQVPVFQVHDAWCLGQPWRSKKDRASNVGKNPGWDPRRPLWLGGKRGGRDSSIPAKGREISRENMWGVSDTAKKKWLPSVDNGKKGRAFLSRGRKKKNCLEEMSALRGKGKWRGFNRYARGNRPFCNSVQLRSGIGVLPKETQAGEERGKKKERGLFVSA